MVDWTDEIDALLKHMCANDGSWKAMVQAIRNKFGIEDVTIGAVSGRCHRQGFRGKKKDAPPEPKRPKQRKPRRPFVPSAEGEIVPFNAGVTLWECRDNQCRWPLGSVIPISDFRMCGARIENGPWPYCRAHYLAAVN